MKRDLVTFKGVSEGVFLDIKGNDLNEIKVDLDQKIKSSYKFFHGARFLGIRSEELTQEEIVEIKLILKYKYDFEINEEELPERLKNYTSIPQVIEEQDFGGVIEGMTRFVYGTLRSGQEVDYNGNIVVIGDVNPGAFLKARGNIVVLGSLKGVAHAGIGGNNDAIVAAYNLLPTQLRVGDKIVRPPEGDTQYKLPEIARIVNEEVMIEPYLPNK